MDQRLAASSSLSATDAARRIERGELTSEALVASCLERIAARDEQVRAWAFVDKAHALAQARALDRGPRRGALHGIPVGLKDVIDTAELPTEYNSPIYRGYRPKADAACVMALKAAGAVILGKTATTEFANNYPAPTRNPRNLAHTPGGSSSGSAAAVADFMVPLAIGTQTGGSVIRPGSYCGIVSCKPTYNLLPRAGVHPNADSLDTVGVYARSVEDVAFFLQALTGRSDLERTVDRPRIGACRTWEWDLVEPPMAAAFEQAAKRLDAKELPVPELFRGLRH